MAELEARAVIGAGYGDEGKGLMTDLLASETPGAVVVRSNGGAQAGHTVVTPTGARHVFHHVGAGALAGAATHLSRHFVAHPMLFAEEWAALRALGAELSLSSDPRALVTTPFDVAINQALELARAGARHGSTGVGFGETLERSTHPEFRLTTGDLFRPDLPRRIAQIRERWLPARLAALGVSELPAPIAGALSDDTLVVRFIEDCERYLERITLWPDRRLRARGRVIFEAAQGLLLDQEYGTFPHVTRSHTGIRNMLQIASEAELRGIAAIYVSRCYATRHGQGPLRGEVERLQGVHVDDRTNRPNPWQGALRLAALDSAVLRDAIAHDLALARDSDVALQAGLAVTCLDQATDALCVVHGSYEVQLSPAQAAATIAEHVGLPLLHESWGAVRSAGLLAAGPAQVRRTGGSCGRSGAWSRGRLPAASR